MKKYKVLIAGLVGVMALSFSACGNNSDTTGAAHGRI